MGADKKNKLRTSQDVLDRIRWDQTFKQEDFIIGYVDRFRGMMELPAPEYEPGGDIPFHRIYYFRLQDGTFMWDRETRLDLIFQTGDPSSESSPEMQLLRQEQLAKALQNTAEVEEEKRQMADQRERRLKMRARQAARRNPSLKGYSARTSTPNAGAEGAPSPFSAFAIHHDQAQELPIFRYDEDEDEWLPSSPSSQPPPEPGHQEGLKVITWNVLFDHHHPELIHSGLRNDALLEILREQDADVIALQEVTFPFLCTLLQQGWVRRGYYSSSGMDERLVSPYGQVLLTRLPPTRLFSLQFMRSSKTALSALLFLRRQPVLFTTLHLTSNHAGSDAAPAKRRSQLQQLHTFLSLFGPEIHHLVAGDFNANQDEPLDHLPAFEDLWAALAPSPSSSSSSSSSFLEEEQEGFTFNPQRNELARLNSMTGQPHRLDRILLREAASLPPLLSPLSLRFLGTQPIPDYVHAPHPDDPLPALRHLHPSDHYGLSLSLAFEEAEEREAEGGGGGGGGPQPTYMTALVIIPPREIWEALGQLRSQSCVGAAMPHINLLYGFWPEELFPLAITRMAACLASFAPFDVTLRDFGYFTHQNTCTAWAKPESEQLVALQGQLQGQFPECDEVSRRAVGGQYTPHMTVGNRLLSAHHALSLISHWRAHWLPASFRVSEVYLIARQRGQPFVVRHVLPLGPSPAPSLQGVLFRLGCLETPAHVGRREGALKICRQLCHEALSASPGSREGTLHVVGSNRLGSQTAESDVDVLFLGPAALPRGPFFSSLMALARSSPHVQSFRLIADAVVPVLLLEIYDVSIDVQYAPVPSEWIQNAERLGAEGARNGRDVYARLSADEPTVRALQALADLDIIRDVISPSLFFKFQNVLRAVRFWARMRQLDSNPHGFLGGISWAILVAHLFKTHTESFSTLSIEAILEQFFTVNQGRDWNEPISINPLAPMTNSSEASRVVKIVTPSLPARNCARNVLPGTLRVLSAELARAASLCLAARSSSSPSLIPWAEVFLPLSPSAPDLPESPFAPFISFPAFLHLDLTAPNPQDLGLCEGWLNRHIIGLLAALERKPLIVRPFSLPQLPEEEEQEEELEDSLRYVIGLRKDLSLPEELREKEKVSFAAEVKDFLDKFDSWELKPQGALLKISQKKA